MPLLSILIPSVPERAAVLATLLKGLQAQVDAQPKGAVEVLVLTDFRTMTLGEKRNRLMTIAQGTYLIHLDDDDELTEDALATLLPIIREEWVAHAFDAAEVIAYDQECTLELGEKEVARFCVRTSLEFENETAYQKDGVWQDIKRKPWHWCAWQTSLAQQYNFIGRVDEDWQWLQQILPKTTRQRKLNQVLHRYKFSRATSLCLADECKP